MKYKFKEKRLSEITEDIVEDEKSGANMLSVITPFILMAFICFALLGLFKGYIAYLIATVVLVVVMWLDVIISNAFNNSKRIISKVLFSLLWILMCLVGGAIIIKMILTMI